jgi:hypothetical protein
VGVSATLADLRAVTPQLWGICARCVRRTPTALAPWIIRWGAEASSDMLRRLARCTESDARPQPSKSQVRVDYNRRCTDGRCSPPKGD